MHGQQNTKKGILPLHTIQTSYASHPASYAIGTVPEVKRSGPKVDQSLPFSVEVKKWSYTSTPPVCGARGGPVGRATALQAGRSRVRFPMVS